MTQQKHTEAKIIGALKQVEAKAAGNRPTCRGKGYPGLGGLEEKRYAEPNRAS